MNAEMLYLVPLLPLVGFLINGLFLNRLPKLVVSIIGCGSVGLAFLISVGLFFSLKGMPADARVMHQVIAPWIQSGDFLVNLGLMLDPLSAIMILVVTGVGFLIHVYSIGYMSHDPSFARFFTYLNLFTFSMLTLVLADNYLLMFVGWEGVGLCSYLLIGFWYEKQSATDAAKKAFIVNRIGDFGFLLGLFIIFWTTGSLTYGDVIANKGMFVAGGTLITAACMLLFVGATGKSAQIPLYIWLPDAMEGPTPVSALIHAATMVTAGVYMIARSNALYIMAPDALMVIAVIGALTALFAATIGLVQNDIKRVLAYSTVSQLGYMFLACGVASFTAGVFHLMTHAFFKALLFLGAGSVIHAMSDEQDMRKMGGLRKHLPITFATMLIATLAIAGIPGLSGFFSKDEILWKSFSSSNGGFLLWLIGFLTAGLTAFYMFRLLFLTFYGKERMDHHTKEHLHESPSTMTIPLMALAVLSVVGGYIGLPHILAFGGIHNYFEEWLSPVMAGGAQVTEHALAASQAIPLASGSADTSMEWLLMAASVTLVGVAILLARFFYLQKPEAATQLQQKFTGVHRILYHKYFVDEFFAATIIRPIVVLSLGLWKIIDVVIIDGIANGLALLVDGSGDTLRLTQSGRVRTAATIFAAGVALLIGYLIW